MSDGFRVARNSKKQGRAQTVHVGVDLRSQQIFTFNQSRIVMILVIEKTSGQRSSYLNEHAEHRFQDMSIWRNIEYQENTHRH